jgi:PhnB protein
MSKVSIYLNFQGNTEEAFNFYKSIFRTEFAGPVSRMSDIPPSPEMPPPPDNEKNAIMHMALPILGGTLLQGTDMLESMGHKLKIGNNTTICLEPDSKEETDRLFNGLSAGGSEMQKPQQMFWGAYWGVCLDKYGIRWMFNFWNQ